MKDVSISLRTPFTFSIPLPWAKASRNLNFQSITHYFVDSHYQDAPQAIVSEFNESYEIAPRKLNESLREPIS